LNNEKLEGGTQDCVIIARKILGGGPQINIDSGYSVVVNFHETSPKELKITLRKLLI
jgi:hypothetical protein